MNCGYADIAGMVFEIGAKSGYISAAKAACAEKGFAYVEDAHIDERFYAPLIDHLQCWDGYQAMSGDSLHKFEIVMRYAMGIGHSLGQNLFDAVRRILGKGLSKNSGVFMRTWCPFPPLPSSHEDPPYKNFRAIFDIEESVALYREKGRVIHSDYLLEVVNKEKGKIVRVAADFSCPWSFLEKVSFVEQRNELLIDAHTLDGPVRVHATRNRKSTPFLSQANEHPIDVCGFSKEMLAFYTYFSGPEKPFYKICQSASYLADFFEASPLPEGCVDLQAHLFAVTPHGVEGIDSSLCVENKNKLSGIVPMLAEQYRNIHNHEDDFETAREKAAWCAFKRVADKLKIKKSTPWGLQPVKRKTFGFEGTSDGVSMIEAVGTESVNKPGNRLFFYSPNSTGPNGKTLRDLHAELLESAILRIEANLSVTLALAFPGAGKTYTVKKLIEKMNGPKFFLYISPRVIINNNVASSMAGIDGCGVVTITTNAGVVDVFKRCESDEDLQKAGIEIPSKEMENKYAIVYEKGSGINSDAYFSSQGQGNDVFFVERTAANKYLAQIPGLRKACSLGVGRSYKDSTSSSIDAGSTRKTILKLLEQGIINVLLAKAPPDELDTLCAMTSLQAFRGTNAHKNMESLLGSAARLISGRARAADSEGHIVVMIDEVTGANEGRALATTLIDTLKKNSGEHKNLHFHLIIADASLVDHKIANYWFSKPNEYFPACVTSSATVESEEGGMVRSVPLELRAAKCTCIEANAYPAGSLELDYRFRLTWRNSEKNNKPDVKGIGFNGADIKSVNTLVGVLSDSAVQLLKDDTDRYGKQVLIFLQNKDALDEIAKKIVDAGIARKEIVFCTAERKTDLTGTTRVILMTSAGSRGVDFPNVTSYIIGMSVFSPEETLMEIQQVLFRGRGSGKDDVDRKIVFCVGRNIEPYENETEIGNTHLYTECFGAASALLMLRSTLFSRAMGRAGLRDKNDVVYCPVGSVTPEANRRTMVGIFNDGIKAVGELQTKHGIIDFKDKKHLLKTISDIIFQDSIQVAPDSFDIGLLQWVPETLCGGLPGSYKKTYGLARRSLSNRFLLESPILNKNKPDVALFRGKNNGGGSFFPIGSVAALHIKTPKNQKTENILNIGDSEKRKKLTSQLYAIISRANQKKIENPGLKDSIYRIERLANLLSDFRSEIDLPSQKSTTHKIYEGIRSACLFFPLCPVLDGEEDGAGMNYYWPQLIANAAGLDMRNENIWPPVLRLDGMEVSLAWVLSVNGDDAKRLESSRIGRGGRFFNLLSLLLPESVSGSE